MFFNTGLRLGMQRPRECKEQPIACTEPMHSNGKTRVSVCYIDSLGFFLSFHSKEPLICFDVETAGRAAVGRRVAQFGSLGEQEDRGEMVIPTPWRGGCQVRGMWAPWDN